jgi:HEAT repeat protein
VSDSPRHAFHVSRACLCLALSACVLVSACDRAGRRIADVNSNVSKRQIRAAIWLATHPTRDALPALRFGLESTELRVRVECAGAIGATGDAAAMAEASRVLRRDALSAVHSVAEKALLGMRALGAAAVPDLMTVALLTTDPYTLTLVGSTIADTLPSASAEQRLAVATRVVDALGERDPDMALVAYRILVKFAPFLQQELADVGLLHSNRRIRLTTMMGLADAHCTGAIPSLARLLSDADPVVRTEAARSLGLLGAVVARPRLTEMSASDPVLDVRKVAAEALRSIPEMSPPDAVEPS